MSFSAPQRLLAFAAALILILAAAATPARAADIPHGFFGLGGWSYPDDGEAATLGAAGLGLFRGALSWDVVEPSPGSRNWSDPDHLAQRARDDGFDILFVLNGCAAWACGAVSTPPKDEPALSQYRNFVADAVSRYGANGSFWAGGPHPRVMWQVGNEVNGGHYFGKNPQPAEYASFLAAVGATIKSVDPTATVVASGLVEKPGDSSGVFLDTFLRGLYEQPGYASSFDVAAVHAYAGDPAASLHVLDVMRRVMMENGDAGRPLWVTEMSWATGGPPHAFTVDEATQAAYLRTTWDQMLGCAPRWNLQRVLWFAYTDFDPAAIGEQDYWGVHNGLLRSDLSPKPSYDAFREYLGDHLPAGRGGSCDLPGGLSLDISDPDTTITDAPGIIPGGASPTVSFTSSEDGVRYQCSLDGVENWRPCTSPADVTTTREGAHWLRVRAIDAQGNIDPTPARADWMLDLSPPSTTLTSRTPRTSGNSILKVSFTADDAVAVDHVECQLDNDPWTPCTSPYQTPRLKAGWHSINVRAIDKAGNVDPTPLDLSFKIDPSKPVLGQLKAKTCAAPKTKAKAHAKRHAKKRAKASAKAKKRTLGCTTKKKPPKKKHASKKNSKKKQ